MTTKNVKPAARPAKKEVRTQEPKAAPAGRYFAARGGRKTATALARVFEKNIGLTVNGKDVKQYFGTPKNQARAMQPLNLLQLGSRVGATVKVSGGGINAQADAVANAVAKAIVKWKEEFKPQLRNAGLMTRDPRMVERKKYGHHKARRSYQWSKR